MALEIRISTIRYLGGFDDTCCLSYAVGRNFNFVMASCAAHESEQSIKIKTVIQSQFPMITICTLKFKMKRGNKKSLRINPRMN